MEKRREIRPASSSALDIDSRDQSSSIDLERTDEKMDIDYDEVEEIFAAENISLDDTGRMPFLRCIEFEIDFGDERRKAKAPTGVDIPQKRRSVLNRNRRGDLSVLYPSLRHKPQIEAMPVIKIRIKKFSKS